MNAVDITIICVTFDNDPNEVSGLLNAVRTSCYELGWSSEVLVVANDGVTEPYAEHRFRTCSIGNVGFSRGVNAGVDLANGEWILVLNPDCTWTALSAHLLRDLPRPGAIYGPVIVRPDGDVDIVSYEDWTFSFQRRVALRRCRKFFLSFPSRSGTMLPLLTRMKLPGTCLLVHAQTMGLIGGHLFDPNFVLYGEDRELIDRTASNGVGMFINTKASILHAGGVSGKRVPEYVRMGKLLGDLMISHRRYGLPTGVPLRFIDILLEGFVWWASRGKYGRPGSIAQAIRAVRWLRRGRPDTLAEL